jgi:3-oxo-5alpha-steroid 4-dehydrogenase
MVGNAIAKQPQGMAWLIMDAERFRLGVKQSLFPGKGMFMTWGAPALLNICLGGTKRAGSLAALARKCGADPAGLERTVADHNARSAAAQPEDPLGKAPDKLKPIARGACYAVNVSLSNKFSPTWAFTLGGLDVAQDSGMVRRADGAVIPGLYAAGRAAIGLCSINYNMSGSSIADTVFSGRRAGRHAAMITHNRRQDG